MNILSNMRLAVLNGWILLLIHHVIFGALVLTFSEEKRKKLYFYGNMNSVEKALTIAGKLLVLMCFIVLIFSPINFNSILFYPGIILFNIGVIGMTIALINFRSAPVNAPATSGLYKISRNPQVFMMGISFLGMCIIVDSVLSITLLLISFILFHFRIILEERNCLSLYGKDYEDYMKRVKRYFLFF